MTDNVEDILQNMRKSLKKASFKKVTLFFITRTRKRIKDKTENETKKDQTNEVNDKKAEKKDIRYEIEYKVLDTETTDEIRKKLIRIGKAKIAKLLGTRNLQYKEYNPAIEWDQPTIEYIEMSRVKYLNKIQKDMATPFSTYIVKGSKVPWTYAIRMDDVGLILFRKFSQSRIFQRKGWIPLLVEDGVFTALGKPGLTIDFEIDCIYDINEQKLYIFNKKEFEDIFSFMDMFTEEIRMKKEKLVDIDLVDDVEYLVGLCRNDPRKTRKLYGVLEKKPLLNLNKDKVRKIKRQYILDIKLTSTGEMVVKPKDIWSILRVLSDDYLLSTVTNIRYETYSKSSKLKMEIDQNSPKITDLTARIDGNVINAEEAEIDWGDKKKKKATWVESKRIRFFPARHTYKKQDEYTVTVTAFRGNQTESSTIIIKREDFT